jgi:hypothetical protein
MSMTFERPLPYRVIKYPGFRFWLLTLLGEVRFVNRMKAKIDEINRAEKTWWEKSRPRGWAPVLFPEQNDPDFFVPKEPKDRRDVIFSTDPNVEIEPLSNGRTLINYKVPERMSVKKVSKKLTALKNALKTETVSGPRAIPYDQDLSNREFQKFLNSQLINAGKKPMPPNVITNRTHPRKKEDFPLDGIGDSKFGKKPSRKQSL